MFIINRQRNKAILFREQSVPTKVKMEFEKWEAYDFVDQLMNEYDDTIMPLPTIELEPHLLISKVRKHYMEYVIKLLSVNYETNQKLLNKNIYLPSAIWRCAKNIEMSAAQACMVVQIYRKNIISVIKELKSDTQKGKLHKKLYECLNKPPQNDKKNQTPTKNGECSCQCSTLKRKRKSRTSLSPSITQTDKHNTADLIITETANVCLEQYKIPVAINLHTEPALPVTPKHAPLQPKMTMPTPSQVRNPSPKPIPVESQDSDDIMLQLEKLFQGDANDDDIFENTLCDTFDVDTSNDTSKKDNEVLENKQKQNSVIEDHAAQIKHLDQRLETLTGLFVDSSKAQQKTENQKNKRSTSKWLCEEYFLKQRLHELLDQIGDSNRKDLARIKYKFTFLFGNDSDDEGVMSPLDETPEFIISCKERIAPWVVKLLTPYYIKGRIRGKSLFKALAKHLIRLIYQCSRYPQEYEVTSFVSDFLTNHQMIRCEADFKEFKIDNI